MYEDETSRACRWHLPAAHFLESWGVEWDCRGRFCYRQPVILPLYGGISAEEVLSGLLSTKGHLITADNSPTHLSPVYHRARKCFERAVNPENKTAAWTQALQRGYSEETAYPPLSPQEETALGTAMAQAPLLPPATAEADWKTACWNCNSVRIIPSGTAAGSATPGCRNARTP